MAVSHSALAQDKQACINASEAAQKLRDDHKLIRAREQFLMCAKEACPGAIKADCADQVEKLRTKIPSIVVRAKDSKGSDLIEATVSIDGTLAAQKIDGMPIALDPGVHALKLETSGAAPVEKQIVVVESEQNRVLDISVGVAGPTTAQTTEPPPETTTKKRGFPIAATVVAGVAVVGFGLWATFGIMTISDFNSAKKSCGPPDNPGCPPSTIDSIHTKGIVADVSMTVGIAAAIGATVLYILHFTGGEKETKAARFLDGTFRF